MAARLLVTSAVVVTVFAADPPALPTIAAGTDLANQVTSQLKLICDKLKAQIPDYCKVSLPDCLKINCAWAPDDMEYAKVKIPLSQWLQIQANATLEPCLATPSVTMSVNVPVLQKNASLSFTARDQVYQTAIPGASLAFQDLVNLLPLGSGSLINLALRGLGQTLPVWSAYADVKLKKIPQGLSIALDVNMCDASLKCGSELKVFGQEFPGIPVKVFVQDLDFSSYCAAKALMNAAPATRLPALLLSVLAAAVALVLV